jgi:hypothetical protein
MTDVASLYSNAKIRFQSFFMRKAITSFPSTQPMVIILSSSEFICRVFIDGTHRPDCLNRSLFA